jgi:microsomal dipeptidase-like Zn-dependent dipeptidase
MSHSPARRKFLVQSSGALAAAVAAGRAPLRAQTGAMRPQDFLIVEGHRDIWEFNDRVRLSPRATTSTLKDHMLPRMLEAGLDVVVMPAGGDSVAERGDDPRLLEGSLRVLDTLLFEAEKTNGVVTIIRTKADLPTRSEPNRVRLFLDIEGGASIQYQEPEPEFHPERRLAFLRHFFRLGCRGMQLTHNGRNMLGVGIGEGKVGQPLSEFGVEVVREMNRLGMVIGVSHLCTAGIEHVVKLTKHPIISTHQNLQAFLGSESPLHLSDNEVKQIASTGGVVGMRYIRGEATYELLADEIAYIVKLVGEDHAAIGWLGHDRGSTRATGELPEAPGASRTTGVEGETMLQHWEKFIGLLRGKGFRDEQIAKFLGGNFLRVFREVIPAPEAS